MSSEHKRATFLCCSKTRGEELHKGYTMQSKQPTESYGNLPSIQRQCHKASHPTSQLAASHRATQPLWQPRHQSTVWIHCRASELRSQKKVIKAAKTTRSAQTHSPRDSLRPSTPNPTTKQGLFSPNETRHVPTSRPSPLNTAHNNQCAPIPQLRYPCDCASHHICKGQKYMTVFSPT